MYEDAGVAFLAAGDAESAVRAYQGGGHWRMAFAVAGQLGYDSVRLQVGSPMQASCQSVRPVRAWQHLMPRAAGSSVASTRLVAAGRWNGHGSRATGL